jgi:CheY-like chemotaxis protein
MAENEKILIADDESEIRKIVRLLLEKRGYSVIEAANGDEAVERVTMGGVDLVIMDIMMPLASGIEATKRIREFSTVPILFLTARSLDSDREDAYTSGGDDYLVKPFSSSGPVSRNCRISAQSVSFVALLYRPQKWRTR